MRKTRSSEEQIIAVLREQEGGMKTADVCRKHGVSSAMLYAWKAVQGGDGAGHGSAGVLLSAAE